MCTLKLFRRDEDNRLSMRMVSVDHVTTHQIMITESNNLPIAPLIASDMIEIQASFTRQGADYETFFIGDLPEHEKNRKDSCIDWYGIGPNSRWGWAVLENAAGNTTQHFRPASYG